jgi:CheY-like chemotaxis protein
MGAGMAAASEPCASILVVEDDQDIREAIRDLLESEGYSVLLACNGKEALEVLKGINHTCLILLDLMMAVMSGWEFLEARRHDFALAPIPVIVVSAVADERVKQAGASGFIKKPVDLDLLLALVKKHCTPSNNS